MTETNALGERWLQCRVDKGMFTDEAVATYPAQGPVNWSEFVPLESVHGNPGETGALRVKVVGKSEGKWAAVLPTPYSRMVFVRGEDLLERP